MERKVGCVKWFNPKKGYGFIACNNEDIFVHHSALPGVNYKYLVQGEYVEFIIEQVEQKAHSCMATDVTGILRGKLMCETRFDNSPKFTKPEV